LGPHTRFLNLEVSSCLEQSNRDPLWPTTAEFYNIGVSCTFFSTIFVDCKSTENDQLVQVVEWRALYQLEWLQTQFLWCL
jgi:hypothetical protein